MPSVLLSPWSHGYSIILESRRYEFKPPQGDRSPRPGSPTLHTSGLFTGLKAGSPIHLTINN